MKINVRRKMPVLTAVMWDGSPASTQEIVDFVQGGWKDSGIWLKQQFLPERGQDLSWLLVLPSDQLVPVGGYVVVEESSSMNRNVFGGDAEWFVKRYEIVQPT